MSRPCTERQAAFLAENGYNPDEFDFDAASAQIDEIIQANPRGGQRRQYGGTNQRGASDNGHRRAAHGARNGGGNGNYRRPQGGNGYPARGGNRGYGNRNQPTPPRGGQRDHNAPATPKQRQILEEYGYDPNITLSQASDIIGALKDNNWEPLNEPASSQPASNELPWN